MNNKSRADRAKIRLTRGSVRKKKEEQDVKKKNKIEELVCFSNRTKLEENI